MGLGLGVGVIWARMIIFVCVSANESAWYRVLDTLYNLQLLPRALTDANFGPESIQMGDNGLTLARVGVALIVCVCVRACVRVSVRVRASVHECMHPCVCLCARVCTCTCTRRLRARVHARACVTRWRHRTEHLWN